MNLYPLFVNLTDRLAVVVGGGQVGRRKTRGLLEAGARVRVIALEPRPLEESSCRVEWRQSPFADEHLDGASLVFAAASVEVNRQVVAAAHHRGLLVNTATEPEQGDFQVPAVLRRGDFLLAVSTGGAAPALARSVRKHLEGQFDDVFGAWVALLGELRPVIRERIADPEQRRAVFEACCRFDWLSRLRQEGVSAVRAALLAELPGRPHHDGSRESVNCGFPRGPGTTGPDGARHCLPE